MRWHTRATATSIDDHCDQNDEDPDDEIGKRMSSAPSLSSATPSVPEDVVTADQSMAESCGPVVFDQPLLDKKGKVTARNGRSQRTRSSSRDRHRAMATAAASAVVIEDEDDDIDEEDEDEYDSYDYDAASGSDHALPDPPVPPADEELDGQPPSPSSPGSPVASSLTPQQTMDLPWRPQNQQSTCEFTHTISSYSQKRESGCKKAEYSSTTVDAFGNRWRLIVYVNGNGRASNHHLSLFLQVADADDLPFGWKKAVSYVLTLEHPSGSSLGYAKRNPDKTFKLCPKAIDWGWSQFITSDRIQQEGYISNDSLTVRASVTVKSSSVSIDAADAELYLKCAVEEGNAESVKACLAQGASVNCQFKDDLYTPLHTACSSSTSSGSLEVLNLLLEKGADGNACNKWRETPLLIAANNGHRAAVEALLDHGADPSLCSEAGWSALTFAAHKGYDQIVSLLLAAGAPVNCRVTEDLSTPLHKACAGGKTGHLSAVKQLLDGGADVHALNKWRETPLLTAANHGQAASVEALLRSGADPCKCTDTGWSPLSIAAYKGHDEVVRILLEEGAPTEEADPTLSALLQAATKGLPDTVELLLRHGADHTVTTKKGDTALSILVEQNLIDAAVEMVTEYKASVPRCSRDRKKVQRARLLINLRVKQQQREGLLGGETSDDDDSEQDEEEVSAKSALHDSEGGGKANASPKKKKKKGKSNANAEAEARAAAEALLQELEEEDQAMKEEAAASSKRAAKKKKKRDRERQHKLKEERERREREERASKERERQQRLKEEKLQKEREQKEKERRERELREAAEREEHLVRIRKEKEDQQRRQREQDKKDRSKTDRLDRGKTLEVMPSSPGRRKEKVAKAKAKKQIPEKTVDGAAEGTLKHSASKSLIGTHAKPSPAKKRGWETKQDTAAVSSIATRQPPQHQQNTKLQTLNQQHVAQRPKPQKVSQAPLRSQQQTQRQQTSQPQNHQPQLKNHQKRPQPQTSTPPPHPAAPTQPQQQHQPQHSPRPKHALQEEQHRHSQSQVLTQSKLHTHQDQELEVQQRPQQKIVLQQQQLQHQQQQQQQRLQVAHGHQQKKQQQQQQQQLKLTDEEESRSQLQPQRQAQPKEKLSQQVPQQMHHHQVSKMHQQQSQRPSPASCSPPYLPVDLHPQVTPMSSPVQQDAFTVARHNTQQPSSSVEEQLAHMANGVVDFLDVDSSNVVSSPVDGSLVKKTGDMNVNSVGTPVGITEIQSSVSVQGRSIFLPVEPPAVSVYRCEKVVELLHRGSQLCATRASASNAAPMVNEATFRAALYRWIARAVHDSTSYVDPIIPSWTKDDLLVTFLQRQFISESKRYTSGGLLNFELFKETGTAMANLCLTLAKDVAQFRSKLESELPQDWTDATVGMNAADVVNNNGSGFVVIDWSGRSQVSIPSYTFEGLKSRYRGPPHRFLTAIFATLKRYETRDVITYRTSLDKRLPPATIGCLSAELAVSVECWVGPSSVMRNNEFFGVFSDVDALFGGAEPFAKEGSMVEGSPLLEKGASVVVMPPLENTTASLYIRNIVDVLERVEDCSPLSFIVILPTECFHAVKTHPTVADLQSLDPRLGHTQGKYVRRIELLPPGQHSFCTGSGDSASQLSQSGSLLVLFQNERGLQRFPVHDSSISAVVHSMTPGFRTEPLNATSSAAYPAVVADSNVSVPVSPVGGSELGGLIGSGFGFKSEPSRSRRGRLFDLVDDGDDGNDMADVSSILDLSSILQSGQDVDIEAISLMGINNNGVHGNHSGHSGGLNHFN